MSLLSWSQSIFHVTLPHLIHLPHYYCWLEKGVWLWSCQFLLFPREVSAAVQSVTVELWIPFQLSPAPLLVFGFQVLSLVPFPVLLLSSWYPPRWSREQLKGWWMRAPGVMPHQSRGQCGLPVPLQNLGCQEPWCHLCLRALLFSTPTSVGFWGRVLTLLKLFAVGFTFLLLLSYLCVSRENNLLFTEDCQWLFSFSGA